MSRGGILAILWLLLFTGCLDLGKRPDPAGIQYNRVTPGLGGDGIGIAGLYNSSVIKIAMGQVQPIQSVLTATNFEQIPEVILNELKGSGTQIHIVSAPPAGITIDPANLEVHTPIDPENLCLETQAVLDFLTTSGQTYRLTFIFKVWGDFNGDNLINQLDFELFRQAVGTANPIFDSNSDGYVDNVDLVAWRLRLECSEEDGN